MPNLLNLWSEYKDAIIIGLIVALFLIIMVLYYNVYQLGVAVEHLWNQTLDPVNNLKSLIDCG